MKKPKYPFPLVEVRWTDAQTGHGWEEETESELDCPEVITVGFLILRNDKGVRVASTVGTDKTNNSRIDIPNKMIISIKELK